MASCGGRFSSVVLNACRPRLFVDSYCATRFSSKALTTGLSSLESSHRRRVILWQCCSCGYSHIPYRSLCRGHSGSSTLDTPAKSTASSQKSKKPPDRIVRVTPAPKQSHVSPSSEKGATSTETSTFQTSSSAPIYYGQKLLGAAKAKTEYCLSNEHLNDLTPVIRRSPYIGEPPCKMYWQAEVVAKALSVHGSVEALQLARERARSLEFVSEVALQNKSSTGPPLFSRIPSPFLNRDDSKAGTGGGGTGDGGGKTEASSSGSTGSKRKGIGSAAWRDYGTERVVVAAVAVNATALVVKLTAWWYTGSHSMMAESLHSLADTINQLVVAYGVHESLRKPDKLHPYGYSNVRYLTSLISGIGIFYIGSAMSLYHGVRGLWLSAPLESLPIGLFVLTVAFFGDGLTFIMAKKTVASKAAASGMTAANYVRTGEDPSLSVVYYEDRAALYGVAIAIASLSTSYYLDSPIPDSIGSICIGLVLFQVAYKIIAMNTDQLLGKSIPGKEIEQITETLEADPVVRSIQDIKATELGAGQVRFKAEIDFDGKHITRAYLKTIDLQTALEEAKSLKTPEELEQFLLKHGEGITDRQGAEIDRIEQALKKKFPDLRHVDLEAL